MFWEGEGAEDEGRSRGGRTSFSSTNTVNTRPRGTTCAISPSATLFVLLFSSLILNSSIADGLRPLFFNLIKSVFSSSMVRWIHDLKAEKSSGSGASSFLVVVCLLLLLLLLLLGF